MSAVVASLDPNYGMAATAPRRRLEQRVPLPRAWTARDIADRAGEVYYDASPALRDEIRAGLAHAAGNGLTLATIEQEDLRLLSLARDIAGLRARLDHGVNFVVIRGLPLDELDDEQRRMLAWAVSNYFGKVIRQNYSGLRVELLKDQKRSDGDPYRISQTNRFFDFHSDNGVLEPRPPNYIGLTCVQPARSGGESVLVSACTLHNELLERRPELLPLLYEDFHADKPKLQTRAGADALPVKYPVFELRGGDLRMRYNRRFIEAGMPMAGRPLTAAQVEALDFLDACMQREDLVFRHTLRAGEMLVANNLGTLHSRTAYVDDERPGRERQLLRSWMWRRHAHPGVDPAELDLAELA